MAQKDIKALVAEIEKSVFQRSEDFRKLVSDFKTHEISLDVEDIIEQVEFEMYSRENPEGSNRNVSLTPATKQIVRTGVTKMVHTLYEEFNPKNYNQNKQKWTISSDLVGTKNSFTFILAAKKEKTANVFNTFKRKKQVAQRPLIKALNKKIKELNKGTKNFKRDKISARGGGFLDIGHQKGSAVNSQRAQIIGDMIGTFSNKNTDPIVNKFLQEFAEDISISVEKSDKGPPVDVIKVGLESKRLNRASTSADKKEVGKLNKELKKAVERFAEAFPEMEGSDSSIQKREKIVVSNFIGPLLDNKNVKIKGPSTKKRKKSYEGKVEGKGRKPKSSKNKIAVKPKKRKVKVARARSASSQPLMLLAVLNKELPDTVRKNMNSPALENRTGTFAGSVKVTDVMQTANGFPSIGYTYKRNPYQVFEVGSGDGRWATPERDPRKLIDRSIREIAAEFAIGRFYTRRI